MFEQLEGSAAVAAVVARCRPSVVCAYPITPQTHIVEALSRMVCDGTLAPCEFINVESEFAALSVAIGASATGARTYTATASQGLLYMTEAIYNAAGLGFPVVMTVANRAIGAPINIWNDHSDSMSQRDCGWLQLFAADNQQAADLHAQAFRIAEELSLPVMVCMDGFVLTHAFEQVELPTSDQIDAFLPDFQPRQALDPRSPLTIGAMVGPEAFTEVRYLAHDAHLRALELIPEVGRQYNEITGHAGAELIAPYRLQDATTVVIALGSVVGTLKDVADELRNDGHPVGVIGVTSYRPFPADALRAALHGTRRVVVVERSLAPGSGETVTTDVRGSLSGLDVEIRTVVAGLGGRPIRHTSLVGMLLDAEAGTLPALSFLDLDHEALEQELRRRAEPVGAGVPR